MDIDAIRRRQARLLRECDVAIGPPILLGSVLAVFVIVMGLNTLVEAVTPVQAAASSRPATPPAN